MYRTLTTAHKDNRGEFASQKDKQGISIQEKATSILHVIHTLLSLGIQYGFYLRRWTSVISVMIYKKAGSIALEDLRIIGLFEAEFNLAIGILFGRRAIFHQIDNKHMHPGQYGRPGGECQDVAFAKILHYHISKFTRTPMENFESDAEACFDRIMMAFAFLCFSVWGAPTSALKLWEKVLFNTEHRVKTGYGTSTETYKYTDEIPIIGPGQGSKGAPAACTTMTIPLLRTLDKLATGVTFTSPTQEITYKATAKMYIDDNTTYSNKFLDWIQQPPTTETVKTITETDAQIWERCLWTSGGALKLHKCKYYIMYWEFTPEGKPSLMPAENLPQIHLNSGDTTTIMNIQQYDCNKAHETLGNWLKPSLETDTAFEVLQKIITTYASRTSTSSLNRYDTWIGYEHVLLPKLTYTFATSSHLPKDLIKLQRPATRATLLKLGFQRNIPTSTIYGVIEYGGLNFKCLFIEQGIAQTTMAMRQIRAQTDIGNLCLIALSWWQLFTGVSMPLWEYPQIKIKYIKHDWFASVRAFLATINGSLHIPSITNNIQDLLRNNDTAIMDHIINSKKTIQEQDRINRVRLWLGVHSLAEITTADGKCITRESWEGTRKRFTRTL